MATVLVLPLRGISNFAEIYLRTGRHWTAIGDIKLRVMEKVHSRRHLSAPFFQVLVKLATVMKLDSNFQETDHVQQRTLVAHYTKDRVADKMCFRHVCANVGIPK